MFHGSHDFFAFFLVLWMVGGDGFCWFGFFFWFGGVGWVDFGGGCFGFWGVKVGVFGWGVFGRIEKEFRYFFFQSYRSNLPRMINILL